MGLEFLDRGGVPGYPLGMTTKIPPGSVRALAASAAKILESQASAMEAEAQRLMAEAQGARQEAARHRASAEAIEAALASPPPVEPTKEPTT